jgi:hypothetical protein
MSQVHYREQAGLADPCDADMVELAGQPLKG